MTDGVGRPARTSAHLLGWRQTEPAERVSASTATKGDAMTVDHSKPGVLTSQSELEVSEPALRSEILRALEGVLANVSDHPMLVGGSAAEAEFDDTTIVLELQIKGDSFVQADKITQKVIDSLVELINARSSSGQDAARPGVQQMSQTLVPA